MPSDRGAGKPTGYGVGTTRKNGKLIAKGLSTRALSDAQQQTSRETSAARQAANGVLSLAEQDVLAEKDLRGRDLSGFDFSGMDLTDYDFTDANLEGANLEGSKLRNLEGVNLTGAKLTGADLVDANLMDVIMNGADAKGADFTGARFSVVTADGADFTGAKLKAVIKDSSFVGSTFVGVDMTDADIEYSMFDNSDFTGATLRATWSDSSLRNCNLSFADVSDAGFNNYDDYMPLERDGVEVNLACDLRGVNWTGAKISDRTAFTLVEDIDGRKVVTTAEYDTFSADEVAERFGLSQEEIGVMLWTGMLYGHDPVTYEPATASIDLRRVRIPAWAATSNPATGTLIAGWPSVR